MSQLSQYTALACLDCKSCAYQKNKKTTQKKKSNLLSSIHTKFFLKKLPKAFRCKYKCLCITESKKYLNHYLIVRGLFYFIY